MYDKLLKVACIAALLSRPLSARFAESYGLDANSMASAGAVTASVNGPASAYYNPAGLGTATSVAGRVANNTIQFGYFYGNGAAALSPDPISSANPAHKDQADYFATAGLTLSLKNFVEIQRNVAFGLLVMMPGDGKLMQIDQVNPGVPKYLNYGRGNRRFGLNLAIGGEIIPGFIKAGIGASVLASGSGSVLIKNVNIDPAPTAPDTQMKMDIAPALSPNFGVQVTYREWEIGLSYNHENKVEIDPIQGVAITNVLSAQLQMDLAVLDHFTPAVGRLGVMRRFGKNWYLELDAALTIWNRYRLSRTTASYSPPVELNNIFTVMCALGLQVSPEMLLQFGTAYQTSAAPGVQNSGVAILDNNTLKGALGASFLVGFSRLKAPMVLSVATQAHWRVSGTLVQTGAGAYETIEYGGFALGALLQMTAFF